MTGKPDNSSSPARGRPEWKAAAAGRRWQLTFFRTLIRVAGRRPAYHIMYIVVFWYALFSKSIRRSTRPYLDRRFPEHANPLRKFWDSYRLLYTFGRTLIDRAAVALLGPQALDAVCLDGEDLCRQVDGAQSAVLVNAHAGVWQIAVSILGFLKKAVSIVMIPPDEGSPIAEMARESMPFKIIDPRNGLDSVLDMMQSLNTGEILGLMGDRVFGDEESTVEATFLGDRILLPFSPYRLAGAAGAPILILLSAKVGYRKYEIRLVKTIHVDPKDAREPESCTKYAQQFADALEEFVHKYPFQFFNFYDMWNRPDE